VHVTASSVPADSGMKVAKEGVENTLVLDVQALPPMASAITVGESLPAERRTHVARGVGRQWGGSGTRPRCGT
jgi:hypothetical protein